MGTQEMRVLENSVWEPRGGGAFLLDNQPAAPVGRLEPRRSSSEKQFRAEIYRVLTVQWLSSIDIQHGW